MFWLVLFVVTPAVSIFHFIRKFVCHYPKSCWTDWEPVSCAMIANSKGDSIDIVPGFQPYAMLVLSLCALAAVVRFAAALFRNKG